MGSSTTQTPTSTPAAMRVPIREALLSSPLDDLTQVHLLASKCRACNEVSLGVNDSCANCGSEELNTIPLSKEGVLWSYTVIRNRPPGDFKGPEPFVPFAEGLIELPEGIRVLSPIAGDIEAIHIGMRFMFEAYPLYQNDAGQEVIAFQYVRVKES